MPERPRGILKMENIKGNCLTTIVRIHGKYLMAKGAFHELLNLSRTDAWMLLCMYDSVDN